MRPKSAVELLSANVAETVVNLAQVAERVGHISHVIFRGSGLAQRE